MPQYSIITVNFNNAQGLQKTIESTLAQSFSDFEILIIDGGSTDGSIDVIQKYKPKITYWISEKDNGIYDAQNKGIIKAKGKYCLFLNSGDSFFSNDVLQNVFENTMNEDILYGNIMLTKNNIELRTKICPEKLTHYFLLTDTLAHQAQFIKTDLFKKIGFYNTDFKIVADFEFFVRAYYKHKIQVKHLSFTISFYDLSGVSAKKDKINQINFERKVVHKMYLPKILVYMYYCYAALLRSKIYKNKAVSSTFDFFRNLVFRFIK